MTRVPTNETARPIPWARWPWQRCPATTGNRESCDLRKRHDGPHVADRGMYDVVWVDLATCPDPRQTADERERRATDVAVPRRAVEIAMATMAGMAGHSQQEWARTKLFHAMRGIPDRGDK